MSYIQGDEDRKKSEHKRRGFNASVNDEDDDYRVVHHASERSLESDDDTVVAVIEDVEAQNHTQTKSDELRRLSIEERRMRFGDMRFEKSRLKMLSKIHPPSFNIMRKKKNTLDVKTLQVSKVPKNRRKSGVKLVMGESGTEEEESKNIEEILETISKPDNIDFITNKYVGSVVGSHSMNTAPETISSSGTHNMEKETGLATKKLAIVSVVACILIACIAVAVPTIFYKNSQTNDEGTDERGSQFTKKEIYEMLLPISPSIAENGSPQHDALDWLVIQDLSLSKERIIQRYILATLYFSTNGEAWTNNNAQKTDENYYWLSKENECLWIGIWCKKFLSIYEHFQPVTALNLTKIGLQNKLPTELGELEELERLQLGDNNIKGKIPLFVTKLTKLRDLHLDHNALSGEIPTDMVNLTQLQSLHLGHNKLQGKIPGGLAILKNLTHVDLSHNSLSGKIPGEFSISQNLTSLILDENNIDGKIPISLGYLTSLKVLSLADNELFGVLDSSIGNLTHLEVLNIAKNDLEGTIPSSLGQLRSLRELKLSKNQFEGSIPSSLRNLVNLEVLHVDHNDLIDKIPEWIGLHTGLIKVKLHNNNMTGEVPNTLCDLEKLEVLSSDCGGKAPKVRCTCCTSCFPEQSEG